MPARKGLDRGAFGIFVDPVHCKGCAECVEVCAALGHDALVMIDKVAEEPSGESTLERYARDMRLFRSLPPTPAVYRNDKALADLLLGEDAIGYSAAPGSCAGCGEATAIRQMIAATRQVHGPKSMGIVAATGCNTVYGSTYPFNPFLVPWTNSLFENVIHHQPAQSQPRGDDFDDERAAEEGADHHAVKPEDGTEPRGPRMPEQRVPGS